jgi:hypothetical protein
MCHVVVTISFGHVHHHATKAKGDRPTDKPTTLPPLSHLRSSASFLLSRDTNPRAKTDLDQYSI